MVVEDARTVHNWLSLLYCQAGGTMLPHLALIRTVSRLNYVRGSSGGNATADLPIRTDMPTAHWQVAWAWRAETSPCPRCSRC